MHDDVCTGRGKGMWKYLSHFGVFTHKGLIRTGEFRWELVDVQHMDSDGHPTGQNWTVWRRKDNKCFNKVTQTDKNILINIIFFTALTSCGY